MAQVTIKIIVTYDDTTISPNLNRNLERSLDRAIQEGLLSPQGTEVVDDYYAGVVDEDFDNV